MGRGCQIVQELIESVFRHDDFGHAPRFAEVAGCDFGRLRNRMSPAGPKFLELAERSIVVCAGSA
jgi:hypothetical protein